MKFKFLIKYILISAVLFSSGVKAQNSSKIAGQYKIATTLLVIKPDNTFLMIDMGILIKGKVKSEGVNGKLIPDKPKELFALYGRTKTSITTGNIINYNSGVSEARPLINYDENNAVLKKMKKIFNDDANCIKEPTLITNPHNNPKFYFSVQDGKEVYEFENNQDFNDFIVLYLTPSISVDEIKFTVSEDSNALVIRGERIEKLAKSNISEAELKKLSGMYDRAFPESDYYYYCNPAYNIFEEFGINLEHFNKVQNGNEYYYLNKKIERTADSDYHNYGIIYEYRKISPVILKDISYSVDTGSVFHFDCN
jgi:hypothetical protein